MSRKFLPLLKYYVCICRKNKKRENGKDLLPNNKIFVFCVNVCKRVCSPQPKYGSYSCGSQQQQKNYTFTIDYEATHTHT